MPERSLVDELQRASQKHGVQRGVAEDAGHLRACQARVGTVELCVIADVRVSDERDRPDLESIPQWNVEPTAGELPDFLPLFLEFISLLPEDEARALLAESAGILRTLADRLVARRSAYAVVFQALAAMANASAASAPDLEQDDPDDLAALDAAWEEAAVQFGPGERTDGCGADRMMTRLRAAIRDVTVA